MIKYKSTFNKLYQKYSNKKYKIKQLPIKDKYENIKVVVLSNDKKETIIKEITKPVYIYYDDNFNLYKLKNKISNEREELLFKYKQLISQFEVSLEDKKIFEKERQKFISLLEEYYIYTLYHKKINKINIIDKTKLILQSLLLIKNHNDENDINILSGNEYNIDNSLINEMNIYNTDKLTEYNNIILQLKGKNQKEIQKDSKFIEEIKLYLDKTNKNDILNKIKDNINKEDNYINYIIYKLPTVN